ncbi:adenosylmethionine-8-amino-7-oxononanoate aminotransferase [Candidatus Scalindua japonica]|uniref:Adenosylmethionine-8-amino-7-oxononanoate aminotransferase n=1 Tax=Candidatus Scalindua japonica TaxID=1284222 RepID=A0A286U0P4_9BACT|nr:adenosylmethionine--8-amino-7-oxononanoate transaminase [Candidatus Scalindua japonica]GAX61707.1 adenosylmethionine-8-amino-7-oxononanoate aminotransferase [Candidatus Scalindua japonica]
MRKQTYEDISKEQVENWDKKYLWHPFTQMRDFAREEPLIIVDGKGVILRDINGKEYIDGISSMWCNIHGHRREEIDNAIKDQLDKVAHTTLLGMSNIPSVKLAKRLVEITPEGLNKVFYSDNGSNAIEIAIKMAFQYWQYKGYKEKINYATLQYGYHGDSLGAVGVSGIDIFHSVFKPLLLKSFIAPSPYCYRCPYGKDKTSCSLECLEKLEEVLSQNSDTLAAMVMEPLVQGAGGMIVHPDGYLSGVKDLCKRYNTLLIADEVLVGFGRTGKMFACEHEEVTPDILTVSKGLNGGYMPLAATLTTDEIYNAFLGKHSEQKTFFHGHTYTGNPLACAAALANINIFEKENVLGGLVPKIRGLQEKLEQLKQVKSVGDVRQCGLIAGVELVKNRETKEPYSWEEKTGIKVCLEARKRGLIIRPLNNVLVIMPPLSINISQLNNMMEIIYESLVCATG